VPLFSPHFPSNSLHSFAIIEFIIDELLARIFFSQLKLGKMSFWQLESFLNYEVVLGEKVNGIEKSFAGNLEKWLKKENVVIWAYKMKKKGDFFLFL
jgi:hypothetical protein